MNKWMIWGHHYFWKKPISICTFNKWSWYINFDSYICGIQFSLYAYVEKRKNNKKTPPLFPQFGTSLQSLLDFGCLAAKKFGRPRCLRIEGMFLNTLPTRNECPLKRDQFNRKYIFQPLIFMGYVSFRGCMFPASLGRFSLESGMVLVEDDHISPWRLRQNMLNWLRRIFVSPKRIWIFFFEKAPFLGRKKIPSKKKTNYPPWN